MIPVTQLISNQLIQLTENYKHCITAFPNQACPVLSSTRDVACRVMMAWPGSTWPGSDLSIKLRSSCSLRQSVSHRFHQHRWRPQSFQLSGYIAPSFCHSYCSRVCFEATFLSWMAKSMLAVSKSYLTIVRMFDYVDVACNKYEKKIEERK